MNQSNVIAGFLAVAFLIFITTRGELPAYTAVLVGGAGGSGGGASKGTPSGEKENSGSAAMGGLAAGVQKLNDMSNALQTIKKVAMI